MKAFQLVVSWTGHVLPFLGKVCPELPCEKETYGHAQNRHPYLPGCLEAHLDRFDDLNSLCGMIFMDSFSMIFTWCQLAERTMLKHTEIVCKAMSLAWLRLSSLPSICMP